MTAWTLVALLCVIGNPQCEAKDLAVFRDFDGCVAAAIASGPAVLHEWSVGWMKANGTAPPLAELTMGCREDPVT